MISFSTYITEDLVDEHGMRYLHNPGLSSIRRKVGEMRHHVLRFFYHRASGDLVMWDGAHMIHQDAANQFGFLDPGQAMSAQLTNGYLVEHSKRKGEYAVYFMLAQGKLPRGGKLDAMIVGLNCQVFTDHFDMVMWDGMTAHTVGN